MMKLVKSNTELDINSTKVIECAPALLATLVIGMITEPVWDYDRMRNNQ